MSWLKPDTLKQRASRAVASYLHFTREGGKRLWLRGHATGVRDARKRTAALLQDAERRVREAEAVTAAYKEERRKAVDEANRRAAIIQSRLPANNGGYG